MRFVFVWDAEVRLRLEVAVFPAWWGIYVELGFVGRGRKKKAWVGFDGRGKGKQQEGAEQQDAPSGKRPNSGFDKRQAQVFFHNMCLGKRESR